MPTQPPKICSHPACPNLSYDGSAYCTQHKGDRNQARRQYEARRLADPKLSAAKRFRSSAAWTKLSATFKAQNPLCCDPFATHGQHLPAMTEDVHHVDSLQSRPDLALDWSNLRPLCRACHSRVEAIERSGGDSRPLFAGNASSAPLFFA